MGYLRKIRRQRHKSDGPPVKTVVVSNDSERIELQMSELEAILERSKTEPLREEDCQRLRSVLQTLLFLTEELEKKGASIQRLRNLLFGATTEKTRKVLQKALDQAGGDSQADQDDTAKGKPAPQKAKGHGRNGVDDYPGAEKVKVPHQTLKPGDRCPECNKGTVYETAEPGSLVRIRGQAPLGATVYELQKLRCHLCGKIFTAAAPPGVGENKYDAESASMIALLKYGSGLPFNRLEQLQGSLGIPLPAATQWEIVRDSADQITPVFEVLIRQAAQGRVLHNDDTGMKVLSLATRKEPDQTDFEEQTTSVRTGVFTSGIVSVLDDHRIALFFTGHNHAGENLAEVLKRRAAELTPPIQMCDALSRNLPQELEVNLLTQIAAYGSADAATTLYTYNEYNEPNQVIDPRGGIRRTFYSGAGVATLEAAYGAGDPDAISATKYDYNSDGWLVTKSVARADGEFDLDDSETFDWVAEIYLYDAYGRRTAAIADVGGENLTTSYDYNYQSEVTKVTRPDSRFSLTERDGQGRVIKEITGISGTNKATTQFYYDLNGNLIKKVGPTDITEVYQYDAFDRMTRSRLGK